MAKVKYPFFQCTYNGCAEENGPTYEDSERGTCCSECDGSVVTITNEKQAHEIYDCMGI